MLSGYLNLHSLAPGVIIIIIIYSIQPARLQSRPMNCSRDHEIDKKVMRNTLKKILQIGMVKNGGSLEISV